MQAQIVTPELRRWIIEQAQAGCRPEQMVSSMCRSGWGEEVALQALEQTLRDHLIARGQEAAMPRRAPMPGPELGRSPNRIRVPDREVEVVLTLRNPRLVVLGGLLSGAECDDLIASARPRMAPSETVVYATGASQVHDARTSRGMFFGRGETALCDRIERRIAALLGWPVENGEGLQVLHYGVGAEYKPHHDYFDPAQPGMAPVLKRGGQRVATLVIYLSTPARGGATVFPELGLEVAPVKGHGVFFAYDRPHPSTLTLHGGAPVIEGEKWVATKWLREREFV